MSSAKKDRVPVRRIVLIVVLTLGAVLLALATAILLPILTHDSAGSSGQEAPTEFVTEVTAEGSDGRTRTVEVKEADGTELDLARLTPGETLTVRGTGFDASIGIYVSFCKIQDDAAERPTPCLGGIPEDAQTENDAEAQAQADTPIESAWVTDNWAWRAFATHRYLDASEGTFEVTLLVPAAESEGLDCRVDECGLYTRADHTALDDRLQDVYLPIGFAE